MAGIALTSAHTDTMVTTIERDFMYLSHKIEGDFSFNLCVTLFACQSRLRRHMDFLKGAQGPVSYAQPCDRPPEGQAPASGGVAGMDPSRHGWTTP